MSVYFKNPNNGYVEKISNSGLLTLFLGCFFFAFRGIWGHFIISLALALLTFGLSWLVYPLFATSIVRKHYLRNGWIEIPESEVNKKKLRSIVKDFFSGILIFTTLALGIWLSFLLDVAWYVAAFPILFCIAIPDILAALNESNENNEIGKEEKLWAFFLIFLNFFNAGFLLYYLAPSEILNWWQTIICFFSLWIIIPSSLYMGLMYITYLKTQLSRIIVGVALLIFFFSEYFILIFLVDGINFITGDIILPITDLVWWKSLLWSFLPAIFMFFVCVTSHYLDQKEE